MSCEATDYETVKVRYQAPICFLKLYRPEANNTINQQLIDECHEVLTRYGGSMTVLVLEGLPEVFCFGADFKEFQENKSDGQEKDWDTAALYDLWLRMTAEPYIAISHVQGKVNAGGMGFVAASDIVIADETAGFSLSELLFGIIPACVLPFLIRRIGFQKANYLTLTTQAISAQRAYEWGLVDVYGNQSGNLLRKELLRLRCLPKKGVGRYKHYVSNIYGTLLNSKENALLTNKEAFSDPENQQRIFQFIETGRF